MNKEIPLSLAEKIKIFREEILQAQKDQEELRKNLRDIEGVIGRLEKTQGRILKIVDGDCVEVDQEEEKTARKNEFEIKKEKYEQAQKKEVDLFNAFISLDCSMEQKYDIGLRNISGEEVQNLLEEGTLFTSVLSEKMLDILPNEKIDFSELNYLFSDKKNYLSVRKESSKDINNCLPREEDKRAGGFKLKTLLEEKGFDMISGEKISKQSIQTLGLLKEEDYLVSKVEPPSAYNDEDYEAKANEWSIFFNYYNEVKLQTEEFYIDLLNEDPFSGITFKELNKLDLNRHQTAFLKDLQLENEVDMSRVQELAVSEETFPLTQAQLQKSGVLYILEIAEEEDFQRGDIFPVEEVSRVERDKYSEDPIPTVWRSSGSGDLSSGGTKKVYFLYSKREQYEGD